MAAVFFWLLIGLQLKHYAADFLMQSDAMIAGKANLRAPGGYVHAGIHAGFSLVVLLLCGIGWLLALGLALGEFVIHYALDFAKVHYSRGVHPERQTKKYWALFGLDQLLHQLTYVAMVALALGW